MAKKKIFISILQLEEMAGSEFVEVELANNLSKDYDVTLLITSKIKNNVYPIANEVKIKSLNMPIDVALFRQHVGKYNRLHKYHKSIALFFKFIYHFIFLKRHYIKLIEKELTQDDVYISSAFDSYLFTPKIGKRILHYHFDENEFLKQSNLFALRHSNKPDLYLFLTNTTKEIVENRYKPAKGKSISIYNWRRSIRQLNLAEHDNSILFIGRLNFQKNPIFMLEIMKELKNRGIDFKFDMYGIGPMQYEINNYIEKNNLSDVVTLYQKQVDINDIMPNYDIFLFPSIYEGFGLVKIEANGYSLPTIYSNWGPSTKEICSNGIDGYMIDEFDSKLYADKIQYLFENKDKLKLLKQSSYEFAKRYDWEEIKKEWDKLLKGF